MRRIFPAAATLGFMLAALGGSTCHASPGGSDEPALYESTGLKIYRGTTRRGVPALVLTNVDDEGNILPGGGLAPAPVPAERPVDPKFISPAPAATDVPEERSGGPVTNDVKVVVQHTGGPAPLDERDVEVRSGETGGTTVIININTAAAPAPRSAEFNYPLVVTGGIVGPFHYPEHLNFLGYGLKNDTPVSFGGLGLSSTERYARVLGRPSVPAKDCTGGSAGAKP